MTDLGNKTTTSGSSASLTGLTLTNYKFLRIVLNSISPNSSADTLQLNGVAVSAASSGTSDTFKGFIDVDLSSGDFMSIGSMTGAAAVARFGASGLSTASTSVTLTMSGGNFDAGSFDVYGYA